MKMIFHSDNSMGIRFNQKSINEYQCNAISYMEKYIIDMVAESFTILIHQDLIRNCKSGYRADILLIPNNYVKYDERPKKPQENLYKMEDNSSCLCTDGIKSQWHDKICDYFQTGEYDYSTFENQSNCRDVPHSNPFCEFKRQSPKLDTLIFLKHDNNVLVVWTCSFVDGYSRIIRPSNKICRDIKTCGRCSTITHTNC